MTTSFIWTGAGDGASWSDPKNWESGSNPATSAPNADDDVFFQTAATITDSGAAFAVSVDDSVALTIDGGSISASFLTVNSGQLDLEDGGTFTVAGANGLVAAQFHDDCTLDVEGSGSNFSAESLYFTAVGYLDVSDGASVVVDGIGPADDYFLILGDTGEKDDTITGDGSSLKEIGGIAGVGYNTNSTLDVLAGASATFSQADDKVDVLELGKGELGEIEVSGDGSSLVTTSGTVSLSLAGGRGDLTITKGGAAKFTQTTNSVPVLIIGKGGANTGSVVTVSDDDSTLTASGSNTEIGVDDSYSTLYVQDGASASFSTTSSDDIALEIGDGGTASVYVANDAILKTLTGGLELGLADGIGTLSIANGSSVTVNASAGKSSVFAIGVDAGSFGRVDDGFGADDSTLVVSTSKFIVGDAGTGTFALGGGGALTYTGPMLMIGEAAGSDGDFEVESSSQSASFNYDGSITVGDYGKGLFDISAGAASENVTSTDVTFGAEAGSSGEGDDEGGTWTIKRDLTVGGEGSGALEIVDGGVLDIYGEFDEAMASGGVATVTFGYDDAVSDARDGDAVAAYVGGVKAPLHQLWRIGVGGVANTSINSPYEVYAFEGIILGVQATGNGTLTVDNALLTIGNADLIIGAAGTGTLTLRNEALVDAGASDVILADDAMSNGTINLYGANELEAGTLTIGASGTGNLNETGGTVTVDDDFTMGENAGGSGYGFVYNKGTKLIVSGSTTIGAAGSGSLTGQAGSIDFGSGAVTLGEEANSSGAMYLNGGATLAATGPITIGESGAGTVTFTQGSKLAPGSNLVAPNVTLGEKVGATGTLTLAASATSASLNALEVGVLGKGSVNVTYGAKLSVASADLATEASTNNDTLTVGSQGRFSVGGDLSVGENGFGTLAVNGAGQAAVSGDVTIGDGVGSIGVATIAGKVTNQQTNKTTPSSLGFGGTLEIGGQGSGQLWVTNGALVAPVPSGAGVVDIATTKGSFGKATVSGAGAMLEGASLNIGGDAKAIGGSATLAIDTGGVVSFSGATTVWKSAKVSDAGTFTIGGALDGDGTVQIGGGGTLSLGGADVNVGLQFAAGGDNETLDLSVHDLPAVQLTGFATSDIVDISGLAKGDTISTKYSGDLAIVQLLQGAKAVGTLDFAVAAGQHDVFDFNAATGALTLAKSG